LSQSGTTKVIARKILIKTLEKFLKASTLLINGKLIQARVKQTQKDLREMKPADCRKISHPSYPTRF
jgi:hypothetical protein